MNKYAAMNKLREQVIGMTDIAALNKVLEYRSVRVRWLVSEGRITGENRDSTKGVLLLFSDHRRIVTKAIVGTGGEQYNEELILGYFETLPGLT